MLYSWYAWHQAALAPVRLAAMAGQQFFSHPHLPFSDYRASRAMAAACEMIERSTRRYEKPDWMVDHTEVDGRRVAVQAEIAAIRPFCNLVRFRRAGAPEDQPKVLLVAPLSGHYATLLRGTVRAILPDHDVYVTDWVDAKNVPREEGAFGLDEYVDYLLQFAHTIGEGVHMIGVCQPAVPVMMATALMNEEGDALAPRSMTLMGGPIDTRINPTQVNDFAMSRSIDWFEQAVTDTVPYGHEGAGRHVYPGFLQLTGFMAMKLDRHVGAHLRLFEHLIVGDGDGAEAHRTFYDEYLSVMDLDARFYLETVERVFQRFELPQGLMTWRGRPIRLDAITSTALMTVEGELDDISAVGQTRAAHDLCPGISSAMRCHYEQKGVGHYGIFNGRRWREKIYPRVRDFIAEHDA